MEKSRDELIDILLGLVYSYLDLLSPEEGNIVQTDGIKLKIEFTDYKVQQDISADEFIYPLLKIADRITELSNKTRFEYRNLSIRYFIEKLCEAVEMPAEMRVAVQKEVDLLEETSHLLENVKDNIWSNALDEIEDKNEN